MSLRLSDLTYSNEELEQDAIRYLVEQRYEPAYAGKVKEFVEEDAADFKQFYDDDEYVFLNLFYDDFFSDYEPMEDRLISRTNIYKLTTVFDKAMKHFGVDDEDIDRYALTLDAEFKKNAMCSHMEPYFVGHSAVAATVFVGYSRNPLFSIYSMAREWCMALHLKYMSPQLIRKFGYRYQQIAYETSGDERLKKLIDFKDRYKHLLKNYGIIRSIHSSVFAYAYIYLKAVLTKEVITAEDFIMDSSSSNITLLLQGESIRNFDFPVTKYVLEKLKDGMYSDFLTDDGKICWEALYMFTFGAIKEAKFEGVHYLGFDSIEAKTMRSFWNKSANMQSMLKVLRQLALENNNPVFRRLIEGCEYHLGRPDKAKIKMERFIEEARKIMAARAYELTKPRTFAQELVAAFPSVFYVYLQWHHNFRKVWPKHPSKAPKLLEQQRIQDIKVKNLDVVLKKQRGDEQIKQKVATKDFEDKVKMRAILQNKERLRAEMMQKKTKTDNQEVIDKNKLSIEIAQKQKQNSI